MPAVCGTVSVREARRCPAFSLRLTAHGARNSTDAFAGAGTGTRGTYLRRASGTYLRRASKDSATLCTPVTPNTNETPHGLRADLRSFAAVRLAYRSAKALRRTSTFGATAIGDVIAPAIVGHRHSAPATFFRVAVDVKANIAPVRAHIADLGVTLSDSNQVTNRESV